MTEDNSDFSVRPGIVLIFIFETNRACLMAYCDSLNKSKLMCYWPKTSDNRMLTGIKSTDEAKDFLFILATMHGFGLKEVSERYPENTIAYMFTKK